MSSWSEARYQAANRFIYQLVRGYGHHMDQAECMQTGWLAYLGAECTYPQVAGCTNFKSYAEFVIR